MQRMRLVLASFNGTQGIIRQVADAYFSSAHQSRSALLQRASTDHNYVFKGV